MPRQDLTRAPGPRAPAVQRQHCESGHWHAKATEARDSASWHRDLSAATALYGLQQAVQREEVRAMQAAGGRVLLESLPTSRVKRQHWAQHKARCAEARQMDMHWQRDGTLRGRRLSSSTHLPACCNPGAGSLRSAPLAVAGLWRFLIDCAVESSTCGKPHQALWGFLRRMCTHQHPPYKCIT
jgi:hypothetical protein